jgi:hypothetical protein
MTQAESVLSTPPTNTPADTTRRRFLTVAAVGSMVGAGSLAFAATAPNDVPKAVTVPIGSPSHRLRAAIRELAAAHETLIAAQATNEEASAMWDDWERANPCPASRRGRKRWLKRALVEQPPILNKPWQDLMTAEAVFSAAQDAVAETPMAGPADLKAMVGAAVVYDAALLARRNSAPIARAIAKEYFRLGSAVQS